MRTNSPSFCGGLTGYVQFRNVGIFILPEASSAKEDEQGPEDSAGLFPFLEDHRKQARQRAESV